MDRLGLLKALAQNPEPRFSARAQLPIGEELFEVQDKGAGRYPYVLSDARFRITLGSGKKMPVALVQIRSDYLAHVGPVKALDDARAVVDALAIVKGTETVSRVDLAVDFFSTVDMESWPRTAWVTHAEKKHSYSTDDYFTGWKIGEGADLSARLYDKTLEIRKESHKYYLHELWKGEGWFPGDPVWRLEFQVRRAVLRRFNIRTLAEVLDSRNGLWGYLTGRWLRLCIPNKADKTRARWPTHPLWASLVEVAWNGSKDALVPERPNSNLPSTEWIARHTTGVLTAQMAKDGTVDIDVGWARLQTTTFGYWQEREEMEGACANDLIIERVRERARKYGTIRNVPSEVGMLARAQREQEEIDAIARREAETGYRKASRG